MGSNSLFVIVDGMVMLCGIYVVYLYIVMVTTGKLTQNVLMPKDINIKKCKDVRGFIKYMGWKQLLFGVIAFFATKYGYPATPMVLAFVLGPISEEYLRKAIVLSKGDFTVFFTRPIALVFMLLAFFSIFMALRKNKKFEKLRDD